MVNPALHWVEGEELRPERRWIDLVREDMEMVGARVGDDVDRALWRKLLRCGDPE